MAHSRNEYKYANWMCASLTLTEQPAGQCPIASSETGPWNDAGTIKWRHADGSDTVAASADALEGAYRCHAVCTSALAIGAGPFVYANGTLGVGATLTGDANGAFPTQDGVAAVLNNVYLVAGQAAPPQQGYYKLTTLGTGATKCVLTRMEPLDASAEWKDGVSFLIRGGTVNADTLWRYTGADSPTMGTTAITLVRDPLVVTTNTAQTITGAKTHSAAIYPDAGIDRSAAAALAIGGTNANAVNVGSASVPISALGGVEIMTTKKLLAGANELAGTVADKLNPVHIAHAAQATGDLLYADSATTMTRLADVAIGSVLASGGVGVAPAYSATPTVTSLTGSTSVLTPNVDAAAATTLALGAATATKVEIADTTVTTEVQGPLTALEGLTVTGNASVSGNLRVTGATVSTSSEAVRIGDNYVDLNDGYATAAAQPGGLTVNYLPTATADTVAAGGFTAAVVGVSNATIATTGAATFALADIIQISGASNQANNGLFEVFSHAANVLTLRGVGLNACVEGFTLNQVVTDATVAGAITKVTVSVLRTGADGIWESGAGAVTPITFADGYKVGGADVAAADGGTGADTSAVSLGKLLRGTGAGTWGVSTSTIPDTFTQGDLVVATGANALGVVADVAANQVLASGGVGVVPAYSATPTVTTLTGSTSVLSPIFDRNAAGALVIGAATATSVEISAAGEPTTVKGSLQVDEASALNGNVDLGNAATDTISLLGVIDTDATFIKEVDRTIAPAASTTAVTVGAKVTLKSANGNGAAAGALDIDTGTGTAGGAITIGGTNAASVAVGAALVPIEAPGGVEIMTTKKLLAGANELAGTVADKLNPVHIAHAAQATGDLLYADSATTMTRLAAGAAGEVLTAAGAGVAPAWGAAVQGLVKRTVTVPFNHASFVASTDAEIAVGAALPANARLMGWDFAAFTGFQNVGDTMTISVELGTGAGGDQDSVATSVNLRVGQTGFPKTGTAGVLGYPMASHSASQIKAKFTGGANLNTLTAGSVTINFFYIPLA